MDLFVSKIIFIFTNNGSKLLMLSVDDLKDFRYVTNEYIINELSKRVKQQLEKVKTQIYFFNFKSIVLLLILKTLVTLMFILKYIIEKM